MNGTPARGAEPPASGGQPPWLLALGLAAALLATGCVAPVRYEGNDGLVQDLGLEKTRRELRQTLEGAVRPRVNHAEVTRGAYDYVVLSWGVPVEKRVAFSVVDHLDVYRNHVVRVYAANGVVLDQVRFADLPTAERFEDLVLSLRRAGGGVGAVWPRPKPARLGALKPAEVREELARVLRRVIHPQVASVKVGVRALTLHLVRTIRWRRRIPYDAIRTIDRRPGQRLRLLHGRRLLAELRFATDADADLAQTLLRRVLLLQGQPNRVPRGRPAGTKPAEGPERGDPATPRGEAARGH